MEFDRMTKYTIIVDNDKKLSKTFLDYLYKIGYSYYLGRKPDVKDYGKYSYELNYMTTTRLSISHCRSRSDIHVNGECVVVIPEQFLRPEFKLPEELFKL